MGRLKACKRQRSSSHVGISHPSTSRTAHACIKTPCKHLYPLAASPSLATPPTMQPCLHPLLLRRRRRRPAAAAVSPQWRSILSLWLPELQEPWQEAAP
ncbi:unnamed protein product, partial [Musa hybrid cultivar]